MNNTINQPATPLLARGQFDPFRDVTNNEPNKSAATHLKELIKGKAGWYVYASMAMALASMVLWFFS